jgi:iron complex outermembrane receptor protein
LERTTLSVSLFYNQYDDLRSIEPTNAGALPVQQQNRLEGDTYGLEAWGEYQVLDWWRLRPAFNLLEKQLTREIGSRDNTRQSLGSDPEYQYSIRSRMDFPHRVELDVSFRYVDELSVQRIGGYSSLDVRIGWHVNDSVQLSLSGFNLLDNQHPESGSTATPVEFRRGVFAAARIDF